MNSLISYSDIVVVPITFGLIIILYVCNFYKYGLSKVGLIILGAFVLKMLFVCISLYLSINYFGRGDNQEYYFGGARVFEAFYTNPAAGFDLILNNARDIAEENRHYVKKTWLGSHTSSGVVCRITGVFSIFFYNSYIALSFVFSFMAFLGCWLICQVFIKIYPKYRVPILFTLFIPSVSFWAALISKDSISLFALGVVVYQSFEILLHGRRGVWRFFLLVLFSLLIFHVKSYIIFIYLSCLFLTYLCTWRPKLKEFWLRWTLKGSAILTLILISVMSIAFMRSYVGDAGKLDPEVIMEISEAVISGAETGGSPYRITGFDWSPQGLLMGSLSALNVTYFRPYIWETKKVIFLPSVIESMFTILFFCWITIKTKWFLRWKKYFKNDTPLIFCLVFSILFGIVAGLFSFTFGTLVRYKIPTMLFFYIGLIIIYQKYRFGKMSPNHYERK